MNMKSLAATIFALSLAACTGTTAPAPATSERQEARMDTFSMPTNLQTTASGLQYTIDRPGTGVQPQPGQVVKVHYSGWLTNGTPFDSSLDDAPLEFPIGRGRVIKGWDEGIAAMKVGERRTLVIPPALAYGSRGYGGGAIPPDATLVFKVELVGVK
jgi:peptidylprolyl isomerase